MDLRGVRRVVETWVDEYVALGARPEIRHVQIFENRGEMMGCSNPHPHGQIWASATVPDAPSHEQAALADYTRAHGACLLCEYLALERTSGTRVVCENDAFSAVVPFWAIWPFEILLLSRRHVKSIDALAGDERDALADVLNRLTIRYDNGALLQFAVECRQVNVCHKQILDHQTEPGPQWLASPREA